MFTNTPPVYEQAPVYEHPLGAVYEQCVYETGPSVYEHLCLRTPLAELFTNRCLRNGALCLRTRLFTNTPGLCLRTPPCLRTLLGSVYEHLSVYEHFWALFTNTLPVYETVYETQGLFTKLFTKHGVCLRNAGPVYETVYEHV